MRVALVMPTGVSPDRPLAGGERYALELARALADKTETRLLTFGPEPQVVAYGPLTIHTCRARITFGGGLNPVTLSHLRRLAWADIIHCLQPRTIVTDAAMLAGRALGKKTFLTDLSGGQARTLSRLIPLRNMMTGFLPISEFNRRQNPWITRPATVIFGGVDAVKFAPDPATLKRRNLFVYVGRLFPEKGLHLLIQALPAGARLEVIGSGTDPAYRRTLEDLARGKDVVFLGGQPDDVVITRYREALAVVLPSMIDTGFTSSMEAMACGTPVIGAALGSLPEVVRDGQTGALVPAGDVAALAACLEGAIADPARFLAMAGACREDVLARFRWAAVADRCISAYTR